MEETSTGLFLADLVVYLSFILRFNSLLLVCLQKTFPSNRSSLRRSRWSRGLTHGSAVACWYCGFESRPGVWMSCKCCVVRQRSLRRADHSSVVVLPRYGVSECYREASLMRSPWPSRSCCTVEKRKRFCLSCCQYGL